MMYKIYSLLLLLLLLNFQFSKSLVIFNAIVLADSVSSPTFSSLVQSILPTGSMVTVHTVESDTITGERGKNLFEDNSGFYNFQLLHITRIKASIQTPDERTSSVIIRRSLPHEAARAGFGILGIESVDFGEIISDPSFSWFTTTYLELPSFAAQYIILGWVLTVFAFISCVLCYCCCCNKNKAATVRVPEMLPAAVVATTTTTQPNGIAWPPIIIGQQQPVIPSGVPVIPLISTTTTTTNNVSNPHPPPPITTTRPATQQPTPSAPPAEQLW